jgi:hypothetical protein
MNFKKKTFCALCHKKINTTRYELLIGSNVKKICLICWENIRSRKWGFKYGKDKTRKNTHNIQNL